MSLTVGGRLGLPSEACEGLPTAVSWGVRTPASGDWAEFTVFEVLEHEVGWFCLLDVGYWGTSRSNLTLADLVWTLVVGDECLLPSSSHHLEPGAGHGVTGEDVALVGAVEVGDVVSLLYPGEAPIVVADRFVDCSS